MEKLAPTQTLRRAVRTPHFELPQRFIQSKNRKYIKVIHVIALNPNGQLDLGVSVHSDLNEYGEDDHFISIANHGYTEHAVFELKTSKTSINFWFKTLIDYEIQEGDWHFLIELEFMF